MTKIGNGMESSLERMHKYFYKEDRGFICPKCGEKIELDNDSIFYCKECQKYIPLSNGYLVYEDNIS